MSFCKTLKKTLKGMCLMAHIFKILIIIGVIHSTWCLNNAEIRAADSQSDYRMYQLQ